MVEVFSKSTVCLSTEENMTNEKIKLMGTKTLASQEKQGQESSVCQTWKYLLLRGIGKERKAWRGGDSVKQNG